jgi:hypothetical protein
MSFQKLQWLFPIAVVLHNPEEAISIPAWASAHASQLPLQPPGAIRIRVALLVLTLAAFAVTCLSRRHGRQSLWAYLTFGYIVAMLLNVFIPHVPASLLFHCYTPGVATALTVNLPLMSYLTFRAFKDAWVGGGKAAAAAIAVPFALVVFIVIGFSI